MTHSPQLSIVVPTGRGSRRLGDLLVSILRQQAAPTFEVIVAAVVLDADVERMVRGLGSRFRYVCSGRPSRNGAKNSGLSEARGQIVLFLEESCFLDDPFFLKRHFETHQRLPDVIAVGGRYTLKRRSSSIEKAFHWLLETRIYQSRIDSEKTMDLLDGNVSFKTLPLRSAYRFNEEVGLDESGTDLHTRLFLSGQSLHLSDRLSVEQRRDVSIWKFVQTAFLQGWATKRRAQQGLISYWKFKGEVLTRAGYLQDSGLRPGAMTRWMFSLYDLAHSAGLARADRNTPPPRSFWRVSFAIAREVGTQLREFPQQSFARELRQALRELSTTPRNSS